MGSIREAVAWLRQDPPAYDLVFMDIRLSDGLSFEIFHQVELTGPVIFVTAYDEYALQAFKTNGIDYILKPFDKTDLRQAIDKFRRLGRPASGLSQAGLVKIAAQLMAAHTGYRQSFLIHHRDKLLPLAAKDIAWIYTLNEESHARTTGNKTYLLDHTLEQLQQQLDPREFFRANRQFIVHRKAIREVDFYFNGRLLLQTEPAAEEKILISKARSPEFKEWMNS